MRTYTIIGGVNGVGKSSFIGVLKSLEKNLGKIIDVDKLTAKAGNRPLEGGRIAIQSIENCIADGVSFTQETTLSGHRIRRTVQRVQEKGYSVRLYYIGLDTVEESKKRIANRVARGGHNVPDEDVNRRFQNRWAALKEILPFCDDALFFDNNNGFVRVASYRNGELILEGDYRPGWIVELSRAL